MLGFKAKIIIFLLLFSTCLFESNDKIIRFDLLKNIENNYYYTESCNCEINTNLFLGNYCMNKFFCCIPMPGNKTRNKSKAKGKGKANKKKEDKRPSNNSSTIKAPDEIEMNPTQLNKTILAKELEPAVPIISKLEKELENNDEIEDKRVTKR